MCVFLERSTALQSFLLNENDSPSHASRYWMLWIEALPQPHDITFSFHLSLFIFFNLHDIMFSLIWQLCQKKMFSVTTSWCVQNCPSKHILLLTPTFNQAYAMWIKPLWTWREHQLERAMLEWPLCSFGRALEGNDRRGAAASCLPKGTFLIQLVLLASEIRRQRRRLGCLKPLNC